LTIAIPFLRGGATVSESLETVT